MASPNTNQTVLSKLTKPLTLHHLKIPAADLVKTYDFYTAVLPFQALPSFNHYTASGRLYGAIFSNGADVLVEVREDAEQAAAQKGFDPITWGVPTRQDLADWMAYLESQGVHHSRIFLGVQGWLICFEDPDLKIVRIYTTEETHEWSQPDKDDYWLKTPE
ncbi:Glyoxalase/Bleomycin resistance protein/Dihydroxybiphenyl dioxygenase [Xylaria longipes]|nr:Glyoxalase/Bleomycin resistance protein/Dihydroxybiphenyl dioxygenase [Xylaria longipes]